MPHTLAKLFTLFLLSLPVQHVHAGPGDAPASDSVNTPLVSSVQIPEQVIDTGSVDVPVVTSTQTIDTDSVDAGVITPEQVTGTDSVDVGVITPEQVTGTDSVDVGVVTPEQVTDIDSVDYWLDKMTNSMSQQNFQGTLIIRHKNKLRAVKVKQGVTEKGSWQTLESLTGENQKIIRRNDRVTTIFPARQLVTISDSSVKRPLHAALPKNYRKLKKYYSMKLSGQDRIANKPTQIVQMIPLDKHRYGYTFWLDRQSGMLLKCDLMDEKRQVLEQLMYSDIELLPVAPDNTIDQTVLSTYKQINLLDESEMTAKAWQANQLPVGFTLNRSVQIPTQNKQSKSYHLVFGDGMASVSVFIEERGKMKKPVLGASSMGTVNAYSSYINDAYITAIGEVPASTVRMIALSIQPVH